MLYHKDFELSATELHSNKHSINMPDLLNCNEHCHIWNSMSSNVQPARHVKPFWESFQDALNHNSRAINVGDRISNALSIDDDKKHASASDNNYAKNREGLKAFMHPNKRMGIVGHTAASPFAHLACAALWEKTDETQTECCMQIINLYSVLILI